MEFKEGVRFLLPREGRSLSAARGRFSIIYRGRHVLVSNNRQRSIFHTVVVRLLIQVIGF